MSKDSYTVELRLTDTCDIMDNSERPDCISIDFNIFKALNSGHPAILCNGHLLWSRLSLRNSE